MVEAVLLSILKMGQIDFDDSVLTDTQGCKVLAPESLKDAADKLGLDAGLLEEHLRYKVR
jgi:hypothetical protein